MKKRNHRKTRRTKMTRKLLIICILLLTFVCTFHADLPKEQGFVEPSVIEIGSNDHFVLDGKFDFAEYSAASNILFGFNSNKKIIGDDGRWAFSTSGDKLIAAVRTPVTGNLSAIYETRDGAIWEDDCHELMFVKPDTTNGYHFIVNSKNGLYDSRMQDSKEHPEWDCKDIDIRHFVEEGYWTTEFQIPISEIADVVTLPEFRVAIYRTNRTTDGYCSVQYRGGPYLDPELFTRAHLNANAPSVSVVTDTNALCQGRLNAKLSAKGQGEISWHVGLEPLDYLTNDAFNSAKEETISEGVFTNDEPCIAVTAGNLPNAGTLHYVIMQDGKCIYDRSLPYDLSALQELSLLSINADDTRKNVCAMIAIPSSMGKVKLCCGLQDAKGNVVASNQTEGGGTFQATLPLEGVAPGRYTFFAKLENGAEETTPFAVLPDKPEWLGNTLGFTNGKAPAPWSDIAIDGNSAKVWNREIVFDGIPAKMISTQGCAADNIRFTANGERMTTKDFRWTDINGDISRFQSTMEFKGGQMFVNGSIEFDGLVWLNCKFTPNEGAALPDIAFKMDIPDGNSQFVYTPDGNLNNCCLLEKDQEWHKNMLRNKSIFWVGSPDVGIEFVADDLRGWNLSDYSSSAQLTADDNGLRIVTVPILEGALNAKDASYQIEFALQATPTRPMPKGYSSFQINHSFPNNNIRCYEAEPTSLFNVPSRINSTYKNRLDYWHNKQQVQCVLPHLAITVCSPFTDEYRFYSEQWRSCADPRPRAYPEATMYYQQICPKGEGYVDWYLWELSKMNETLPQDGLYFDFSQPIVYPCKNALHGCAWTDNHGSTHPSLRIKAARELIKRIYVFMKGKNPNAIIAMHNSGGIVPAFDCFCDFTFNGEQTAFTMFNNGANYRDFYDPRQFTLEQNGRIWGVPAFFIPQFLRVMQLWDPFRYGKADGDTYMNLKKGWIASPDTKETIMHFLGLLYAVGGDCDCEYGVLDYPDKLRQEELSIGWNDETKFYGWFDKRNPFKLTNAVSHKTIVSSYEALNGWMIVALNDTKNDEIFRIEVPENLRSCTFREHITQQTISVKPDGSLEISVPALCARFIMLKID